MTANAGQTVRILTLTTKATTQADASSQTRSLTSLSAAVWAGRSDDEKKSILNFKAP